MGDSDVLSYLSAHYGIMAAGLHRRTPMSEDIDFLAIARRCLTPDAWGQIVECAIKEAATGDKDARNFIASFCLPKDREASAGGKVRDVRLILVAPEEAK